MQYPNPPSPTAFPLLRPQYPPKPIQNLPPFSATTTASLPPFSASITASPLPKENPPLLPKEPQNAPTFVSLFRQNRDLAKCTPLDANVAIEDDETIMVREEELLSIEDAFGYALLGCVIGGEAFPRLIQGLIKAWNVPCKYSTHHNGWILFQFGTKEEMEKVLANGPYSTLGRQWMLKEVPQYFSFKDSCFSSVPIWVNLKFLPKQCWSKGLLSRIARKIGKPIAMDVVTGDKSKHEGARLLVEVDLSKPIVDKVSITMPDGRIWDQMVDFDIKPVVCSKCKGLGHKEEDCKPKAAPKPRGRSVMRRGQSKRPDAPSVNPRGKGEGGSGTTSSILSALPVDKGKGKVDEEVVPQLGSTHAEASKEAHRASPSLAKGMSSGAKGSNPRIHDLYDELIPTSPNSFAPLFDDDERAIVAIEGVEALPVDVEVISGKVGKNPGARPGKGVKEEDLRRSGRRRRGVSSS